MSNTKSTQSGIYEISLKFIAIEMGYSKDYVEELIRRFCDFGKILYNKDTNEIMLLNWIKYNSPNNINAILGVRKELKRVKNKEFIKALYEICKAAKLDVLKIFENFIVEKIIDKNSILDSNLEDDKISVECCLDEVDKLYVNDELGNNTDVIFMKPEYKENLGYDGVVEKEETKEVQINNPLGSPLQAPCKGIGSNRIRSKEQEVINKEEEVRSKEQEIKNKEEAEAVMIKEILLITKCENEIKYKNNSADTSAGIKKIIKVFKKNIQVISPFVYEEILSFTKKVSSKVIIMAIYEAVSYNFKTINILPKYLITG